MLESAQIFITDLDAVRLRNVARQLHSQHGEARHHAEELMDLVDSAAVVPADSIAPDVVTMNSTVVYDDAGDGPVETLMLVYPEHADAARGRVSVLSPLGRTLIGLRAGMSVDFETPGHGTRSVRVRKVLYQPEAAGDWTL
ncbi:MAG: nucleoside diphosphate kinase regulator [Betaproteobacteria bacterium]|jgi:regulator of nucleoside diphosphate kinase